MIRRAHILHAFSRLNWAFVLCVLQLMIIGVVFIYSASSRNDEDVLSEMAGKQLVWCTVGSLIALAVIASDYRKLKDSAAWLFGISAVMLALVFVVGITKYGASRWLSLFGIQVQPSEFAKLGTVILLASFLSQPSRDTSTIKCLIQVLLIVAVPFVLIMEQPDLGTAMTLVPLAFVMMFVGGVRVKHLASLVVIGLMLLPVAWYTLEPYQKNRILVFLDPARDPLDAGWNTVQSAIAVGSGGLTGKGYLEGTQNILGFLPRTVAPTDFIFSVIAEEMGFVGSALLLLLFATVLIGGMRAALRSRDKFGRLLATGVVTLLFFHVFVNMAMTIGLMPITGIPLPLVSYGGSFMICTLTGLGIVQSVYVRRLRH